MSTSNLHCTSTEDKSKLKALSDTQAKLCVPLVEKNSTYFHRTIFIGKALPFKRGKQ